MILRYTSSLWKQSLWLGLLFLVYPQNFALAMSRWGCAGVAGLELLVPGLGQGLTENYGQMFVLGGARLVARTHYRNAVASPDYQENVEEIYDITPAESAEEKNVVNIHLNEATWNADYYGTLSGDLFLVSAGDLLMHNCKDGAGEAASHLFSPFRVGDYFHNWKIYPPLLVMGYVYATFGDFNEVNYHLGKGLTEGRLKQDSFSQFYMVGVGEEVFFRGGLQTTFYDMYRDSFGMGEGGARHAAVWTAAVTFGLAHNGQGFSASPPIATAMGAYLGYLYMPGGNVKDLPSAIIVHVGWDMILAYAYLNHASFLETEEDVRIPLANIAFQF